MQLRQVFSKVARKAGIVAVALSLAFMAGCGYPSHNLGQDPGLQGTTQIEQMFDGAPAQHHLTIDGSALQAKNHYTYDGSVTVRGSVPANTEITVSNGRLEVTGNVGDRSEIEVTMPQKTHSESYTYTTFMMVGKTMIPMVHTGTRTVVDGLLYPADSHAAVKVDGAIGNRVQVSANGGISAGGWGTEFKAETGYGRPLQQVPAPTAPRIIAPGS